VVTAREEITAWLENTRERPSRTQVKAWVADLLDVLEASERENACRAQIVAANRRLVRERDAAVAARKELVAENRRLRARLHPFPAEVRESRVEPYTRELVAAIEAPLMAVMRLLEDVDRDRGGAQ
jgi:hypothetical protein